MVMGLLAFERWDGYFVARLERWCSEFRVRLVVERADGADGVFEEIRQGVFGDFFDGFFGLTVVVDGRVFDGDAIEFGDEVVCLLFGFSR